MEAELDQVDGTSLIRLKLHLECPIADLRGVMKGRELVAIDSKNVTSTKAGVPRNSALDVIRVVAVLLVMGRHMTPECPPTYRAWKRVFDSWSFAGWAGVDLFFVLSGFLVSGLLFREFQSRGSVSAPRFLLRRGLKIWPGFYLLLVGYGFFEWRWGAGVTWRGLAAEALYVQNYVGGIWNHTWSLAVEEHFYLFIALVVAWMVRTRRLNLFPRFAVGIMGICLVARIVTFSHGYDTLFPTHLRLDSLIFGSLLAYWLQFRRDSFDAYLDRFEIPIAIASFALLTPLFLFDVSGRYFSTLGYLTNALAFGGVIVVCFRHHRLIDGSALGRLVARIGVDTYAIYLWHMFAKRVFSYLRKGGYVVLPYWAELAGYIALSVLLGMAVSRLLERPLLALRDRWIPSRSGQLA